MIDLPKPQSRINVKLPASFRYNSNAISQKTNLQRNRPSHDSRMNDYTYGDGVQSRSLGRERISGSGAASFLDSTQEQTCGSKLGSAYPTERPYFGAHNKAGNCHEDVEVHGLADETSDPEYLRPDHDVCTQVHDGSVGAAEPGDNTSHEFFDQQISLSLSGDLSQEVERVRRYSFPYSVQSAPRFSNSLPIDLVSRKMTPNRGHVSLPLSIPRSLEVLSIELSSGSEDGVTTCVVDAPQSSESLMVPSFTRSRSNSQGRKRQKPDDVMSHDSENEFERKHQRTKEANSESENKPPKLFACHYFKRDPIKHLSCFMRFRLKRVKDVKQHLNRKHSLPEHYCPTCWATFSSHSKCDEHIRERSCAQVPKPVEYDDAMTADQKKAISRRTDSGTTENEHWYNSWRILFGAEDPPTSPYLKNTEVEELISTVRWFWKENSPSIVANILSSHQGLDLSEPGNALPSVHTTAAEEKSSQSDALKLTETMDVLLDRFENAIHLLGRQDPQPPSPQCLTPPPLLSESSFPVRSEVVSTNTLQPRIEVNECAEDHIITQSSATGLRDLNDGSTAALFDLGSYSMDFDCMEAYPPEVQLDDVESEDFEPLEGKTPSMNSNSSLSDIPSFKK